MTESNKVFITAVLITGVVVFLTTAGSILFLYHTAVEEQKERLLEIGIVAKIFLKDLRSPFIKTAFLTYVGAFVLFFFSGLIIKMTVSPLVAKLEKQKQELESAFENIKTLSGLLPICAHCKKIRDDKGYWHQIEIYIDAHSDVSFSHGLCMDCSDTLYGKEDWYMEIKTQTEGG